MNRSLITTLLLSVTATGYADPSQLAKQRALDMIRHDPNHMSEAKTQLGILLSDQTAKQALDAKQRQEEHDRRKKLEAQKLLNYAKDKHAEAVARRKQGLSLETQAHEKKAAAVKKQVLLEAGKNNLLDKPLSPSYSSQQQKHLDVYAPYNRHHQPIPDYRKDSFPNR